MINVSSKDRDQAKSEPHHLKLVLEDELENVKGLLTACKLENFQVLQGRALALTDIINLLS